MTLNKLEKILAGLSLGGALCAGAIVWTPAEPPSPAFAPIVEPIAPPNTTIEPELPTAMLPPPAPVEGQRPKVAVAHEEKDVDHLARAAEAFAEGDLAVAYDGYRRYIFSHEPTSEVLVQIGMLGRRLGDYAVAEQAL